MVKKWLLFFASRMKLSPVVVFLFVFLPYRLLEASPGWSRRDQQQPQSGQSEYKSPSSISGRADSTDGGSDDDNSLESRGGDLDENKLDRIEYRMNSMAQEMRSKDSGWSKEPLEQMPDDSGGNIRIAVQSKRKFEFVPAHFDRENSKTPRMIEIVSDTMPLRLHFKSQSAAIVVSQSHMSPPMKPIEETVTMDEPYRLSHQVHKPIIQEVKEIIQPYRNIVQQVKPVIEDIRTIVPQDNDVDHQHNQSRPSKMPEWNPRKGHKTPPPPPPPRPKQYPKFPFKRNLYDQVKASESHPARIQKRMHQDSQTPIFARHRDEAPRFTAGKTVNDFYKGNRYHHEDRTEMSESALHGSLHYQPVESDYGSDGGGHIDDGWTMVSGEVEDMLEDGVDMSPPSSSSFVARCDQIACLDTIWNGHHHYHHHHHLIEGHH